MLITLPLARRSRQPKGRVSNLPGNSWRGETSGYFWLYRTSETCASPWLLTIFAAVEISHDRHITHLVALSSDHRPARGGKTPGVAEVEGNGDAAPQTQSAQWGRRGASRGDQWPERERVAAPPFPAVWNVASFKCILLTGERLQALNLLADRETEVRRGRNRPGVTCPRPDPLPQPGSRRP